MGGLIETENEDRDILFIASGSAAAQSREAVRLCAEEGIETGLVKIASLRPFPTAELRKICKHTKLIVVPEFNYVGWLAKDIAAAISGYSDAKVVYGPHVYGGMSMPVEMILDEVVRALNDKTTVFVPRSMKDDDQVDPVAVGHFMQNI